MNYQFLKKCVESAPITPMQQELFDNILSMIPENLKKSKVCKDVIEELFEEISTDFNKSMKKSMGKLNVRFKKKKENRHLKFYTDRFLLYLDLC